MLKHLLRYDIRETGRKLLMMYLILAGCALLTNLFGTIGVAGVKWCLSVSNVLIVGDVIIAFALGVMTIVACVERFIKSCYGSEGYLTFTLPVQTWQVLLSKVISAALWCAATALVILLCIALAVPVNSWDAVDLPGLFSAIGEAIKYIGSGSMFLSILNVLVAAIISGCSTILMIDLAISIGQLFTQHKVAAGFVSFFIIQAVISTLTGLLFAGTTSIAYDGGLLNYVGESSDVSVIVSFFNGFIGLQWVWMLIISAAMFFGTTYIMKNHLNLE
ncbi:MAG: hypothetical protein ACOYB8_01070 [Eubacteriaceae bacterium]|jgi:hypothetical protein